MHSLLSIVCFVGMVEFATSCSCLPMSLRKKYCNTHYIVEIRVLSDLINQNGLQDFDDFYRVNVLSELKPNETIADLTRVYTGSNGGMCGVHLRNDTEYIIGGEITKDKRLSLNLCRSIIIQRKRNGRLPKFLRRTVRCKRKAMV